MVPIPVGSQMPSMGLMPTSVWTKTAIIRTTGRFTPYWTRDDKGNIAIQPLVEYDTYDKHPNGVLKGGWYITPREQNKESVLGPLPYIGTR